METDAVVHVIDDDDEVRRSLGFLLRSVHIEAIVYASATAFLDTLPSVRPGCIVTDVRMPIITGIDLLRRLRELGVSLPVIVMTGHGDVPLAVEAMKNGALDFLEKPFDDESLVASVRLAIGRWQKSADRDTQKLEYRRRIESLSGRERDVFEGLVAGHPNKTIGYNLGISSRTVEIYRANAMTKMNATSLSELVRMAMIARLPKIDGSE
jgi:two-component system response regulator FixJ